MEFYPSIWLFNTHLETVFPALCRKVEFRQPKEIEIHTPDDDFLEVDEYFQKSRELVVICHGLEGNSRRPYMLGMAKTLYHAGFDVVAWNYRGCGNKMNKQKIMYHSGATYDLDSVVKSYVNDYEKVHLAGFSMGGNLILKYLGEQGENEKLGKAFAVSVPLDLEGCGEMLGKPVNYFYSRRFLNNLKEKVKIKARTHNIDLNLLKKAKTLWLFDEYLTAPIHGFQDARDYYRRSSSGQFLEKIKVPALILNAKNDTFLSDTCYPDKQIKNPLIHWVITEKGGHVGFRMRNGGYFTEKLAVEFFIQK